MKTTKIRKVLGFNVKYYRYIRNLTQEQLAEDCSLSPRYISDIENGKGNVAIDTLEKISDSLNIEPYILLKEQDHKTLPKRVNMK